MVPKGWKERTVGDLLEKVTNPVNVNSEEIYREIGIRSHSKGIFHKEPISGKAIGNKRVFHIEPNCLIINIVFAWEQAVAKTTDSERGMIASHRFPMYRPKKERCDIDYILYLFKTKRGKYLLELASPGGAGRNKTLGQAEFFRLQLIVPPLIEQIKIAQILSTWDNAINTIEKLLINSQQQKKGLMQQLFTGKKRLLDESGIRFSNKWKKIPIKRMGKVVSGGTPDTNTTEFWDGDINWLTPTDVTALKTRFVFSTSRTISELGVKNSSATILPGGSLMVCTRATVGALAISTSHICTNQGFKSLIPNSNFDVDFIYYLISYHTKELVRKACGSTFLELSKKDFEKIEFSCGSLDEQKKISKMLSAVDEEISVLQKKLVALKNEKKALMQQLLTGKRRVKVN